MEKTTSSLSNEMSPRDERKVLSGVEGVPYHQRNGGFDNTKEGIVRK